MPAAKAATGAGKERYLTTSPALTSKIANFFCCGSDRIRKRPPPPTAASPTGERSGLTTLSCARTAGVTSTGVGGFKGGGGSRGGGGGTTGWIGWAGGTNGPAGFGAGSFGAGGAGTGLGVTTLTGGAGVGATP